MFRVSNPHFFSARHDSLCCSLILSDVPDKKRSRRVSIPAGLMSFSRWDQMRSEQIVTVSIDAAYTAGQMFIQEVILLFSRLRTVPTSRRFLSPEKSLALWCSLALCDVRLFLSSERHLISESNHSRRSLCDDSDELVQYQQSIRTIWNISCILLLEIPVHLSRILHPYFGHGWLQFSVSNVGGEVVSHLPHLFFSVD